MKKIFNVGDKKLAVLSPTQKQKSQAQFVHSRAFREAAENGAVVREKLEGILRKQNLWDDERQKTYADLIEKLREGTKKLGKGKMKFSDAKALAFEMAGWREELRLLLADRHSLDSHTAQAQADQASFNFLISECCVYAEDNKRYWKTYEDFQNSEEDEVIAAAGNALYECMHGENKTVPAEQKFLRQYGVVNADGRLVNARGELVDRDGRRVNENGQWINDNNELVDVDGNRITTTGEYVDFEPFLDDDGNPLLPKEELVTAG